MYSNWFKDSELFSREYNDKTTIGFQIQKDPDSLITIGTKVVIFGYDEEISDAIRRDLYACSFNFDQLQLIDLGNLRKTEKDFIVQMLTELNEAGMNIIALGTDQTFQYAVLNSIKTPQNIAFIEKTGKYTFDPAMDKNLFNNENIRKIKLIGYQGHLLHKGKLEPARLNHSLSLGEIRNNMREAEPVLRDVTTINFMLESIRYAELPGIKDTSPSGLTSEEACQLMRYFGLNPLSNCLSLYGYNPKYDFHDQGLKMVSQLIWYYLEGLDQKKMDRPDFKENMTQYLVDLSEYNLSLPFYKSDFSGRWWVEIPLQNSEDKYLLPCSYMDYKKACSNEMPKRIMKELQY